MSVQNHVIELNIKQNFVSPVLAKFSIVQFDTLNSFEFRVMDEHRTIDYANFNRVDLEITQGTNVTRVIENIRINNNSFSYNVQADDFTETGRTVIGLRLRNYNNQTVSTNKIRFNVLVSNFDDGTVFPNIDNYTTRIDFDNHLADNQRHTTFEEKQIIAQGIEENKVGVQRNIEEINLIKEDLRNVNATITDHTEAISNNIQDIQKNTTNIETNSIRIDSNRDDINSNANKIDSNETSIRKNTTDITINRNDINQLIIDVDRIRIPTNVTVLEQRITALESQNISILSRLNALES